MRSRILKSALFVLAGMLLGTYFLRCGNDAGIGSDFDATQYYTKDEINALLYIVEDVALDVTTGRIPADYKGPSINRLYLKHLPYLQKAIKTRTGKPSISLADIADTIKWIGLKAETYNSENPPAATLQKYRFARVTGDPLGSEPNIYWPINIANADNVEDIIDDYKLIYVTVMLK
jgi:hypothetical protein